MMGVVAQEILVHSHAPNALSELMHPTVLSHDQSAFHTP